VDDWKQACGYVTDNAAAMMLQLERKAIARWRNRELCKVERLAMAAVYHRISPFDRSVNDWMYECGFATDNAASSALQVDRHTIANWRKRDLTKFERLAMAAVYHRIEPFDRTGGGAITESFGSRIVVSPDGHLQDTYLAAALNAGPVHLCPGGEPDGNVDSTDGEKQW
jgi:hypothetical protein